MRIHSKCILLLGLVIVAGTAQSAPAVPYDVNTSSATIKVAANVQKQIDKLSAEDKKRVEEAMKTGAAFMTGYLGGIACDTSNPGWDEEFGGVVAMDSYEWQDKFCGSEYVHWDPEGFALSCPQVLLVELQLNATGVALKYETVQMGTLSFDKRDRVAPKDFITTHSGTVHQVVVAISADNKVYSIAPIGPSPTEIYGRELYGVKQRAAIMDEANRKPNANDTTKEKGIRYKILTKQIEQQAEKVCK